MAYSGDNTGNQAVPYAHPAWIEIDLAKFRNNIAIIKEYIGSSKKLCIVVKANAYGHGLIDISHAAVQAGVDYLAVASLQEGARLRQAGISLPILVMGAIHEGQIEQLIEYALDITISSCYKARLIESANNSHNSKINVHLEIDTGMQRTGVCLATAYTLFDFIRSRKMFNLKGIYTHFVAADSVEHYDLTLQQSRNFFDFMRKTGADIDANIIGHIANSSGLLNRQGENFDMVRLGLLAYGYLPGQGSNRHNIPAVLKNGIKPCFSLKAKVSYFKVVRKNQGISYNHSYIAAQDSHILTVPVGYGDGLRRSIANKAHVLLKGRSYPIVGDICMDQCMINIGRDSGYVGDLVTFIGADNNNDVTVADHCRWSDTIAHEILSNFNERLPRIYINGLAETGL